MTRAHDIKQLIAEESTGTAERRLLEEMASRLEDTLSSEVPYRPEFKAHLRRQLMVQARRQLTPWYRRPAFLGSGVAVAAAAAVLFVGLRFWTTGNLPPENTIQTPIATEPTPLPPPPEVDRPSVIFTVSLPADLRQLELADEPLSATSPGPDFAGNAEVSQGLQLKRLTARPGEEELRTMASRLTFRGESRQTSAGWQVSEGSRTLLLRDDGQVIYTDTAPAEGPTVGADTARQAAFQFLDKALLPVPGQPVVLAEPTGFQVVYTEQVEGRPVVNARTVITVNDRGMVTRAEAYVSSGTATHGTYANVLTEAEAVEQAKSRGGSFDRADLVWARTPGEGTVYLQPYWRVFGTDTSGTGVVRYVPALKR